ncbi:TPA: hypothetical protein I7286_08705 [Vibrio parahaemolyticus]|nr:hypothetical protein [Vibrio parahaemolyticus]
MKPYANVAAFFKARAVLNILRTSKTLTEDFLTDPKSMPLSNGIELTDNETALVLDVINNTRNSQFDSIPFSEKKLGKQPDKLKELQDEWKQIDPR